MNGHMPNVFPATHTDACFLWTCTVFYSGACKRQIVLQVRLVIQVSDTADRDHCQGSSVISAPLHTGQWLSQ